MSYVKSGINVVLVQQWMIIHVNLILSLTIINGTGIHGVGVVRLILIQAPSVPLKHVNFDNQSSEYIKNHIGLVLIMQISVNQESIFFLMSERVKFLLYLIKV